MRDSKSTQNITFQKFDHYFDLELSLSILKHNLLRQSITTNICKKPNDEGNRPIKSIP
jgi:hypothetical protein